jgi:hypothetical protein
MIWTKGVWSKRRGGLWDWVVIDGYLLEYTKNFVILSSPSKPSKLFLDYLQPHTKQKTRKVALRSYLTTTD